jgi:RimJ/RimL family protein N-acetyltransferase
MNSIRAAVDGDWPQIWQVLEPVFRAGETYPQDPAISAEEARSGWMELPDATYVALDEQGRVVGTYYIKANQQGLGAHVCNCGYAVHSQARGQGIAARMCEHSQQEALRMGFRAMQFNLVVSTNETAVRLWSRMGFQKVGVLTGAFRHARHGYVDAFVMYKTLVASD